MVTQHPRPDRAVCVISTFVAGQSHLHNSQTAYSAALFTPPADFIDVSGARPRCLPDETPLPPCQLWTGVRLLPHDADVRVHDGLGLHVVIPEERTRAVAASTATESAQAISEGSGDDEVVLFHVAQTVQPSPLSTTEDSIECSCHGVYTCGVNISSNVDEANFYQQTSTTLEQPVLQWNPAMPDPSWKTWQVCGSFWPLHGKMSPKNRTVLRLVQFNFTQLLRTGDDVFDRHGKMRSFLELPWTITLSFPSHPQLIIVSLPMSSWSNDSNHVGYYDHLSF